MRILVISFRFPPFNSVGAVRVGKLSKYLREAGHDLRVLTADDQPLDKSLPVEIPEGQVCRTGWTNINRLAAITADGGEAGVRQRGYVASGPLAPAKRFLGRTYKALTNFPDGQIGWYRPALSEGARILGTWRPDVIFASAAPFTSFLIAAALSKQFGIPWVADYRDLWADNYNYPFGRTRHRLESLLEERVVNSAAACTSVSEALADRLGTKFSKPTQTIYNGYDPSDFPERTASPGRLLLSYTGRIYPHHQDLRPLIDAVRQIDNAPSRIRIRFYGRYLDSVGAAVTRAGLNECFEVHPQVPYAESLRIQRDSDALIFLGWNDQSQKGVLTGKLFEYIGSMRPILSIGVPETDSARLISSLGAGIVATSASDVARAIERLLAEKEVNGEIADRLTGTTDHLTRRAQAVRLSDFLMSVA